MIYMLIVLNLPIIHGTAYLGVHNLIGFGRLNNEHASRVIHVFLGLRHHVIDSRLLTAYQPGSIVCLEHNNVAQWQINWMIRPELLS